MPMPFVKLLRSIDIFYILAVGSEKLPKNSNDLTTILKNLDTLDTFQARIKYAEKNLKHLSSGSSRIVYLTPEKTVVKLAKNEKGLAQNKAEANPDMKSKFINKILKHSKEYAWLETSFLDKITEKEFEEMTRINFKDFGEAISHALKEVSETSTKVNPKCFDKVEKSPIFKEMERLGKQFKLLPGDLERISSWGKKDNQPVLIDAGLTRDVFDKFYEEKTS